MGSVNLVISGCKTAGFVNIDARDLIKLSQGSVTNKNERRKDILLECNIFIAILKRFGRDQWETRDEHLP